MTIIAMRERILRVSEFWRVRIGRKDNCFYLLTKEYFTKFLLTHRYLKRKGFLESGRANIKERAMFKHDS